MAETNPEQKRKLLKLKAQARLRLQQSGQQPIVEPEPSTSGASTSWEPESALTTAARTVAAPAIAAGKAAPDYMSQVNRGLSEVVTAPLGVLGALSEMGSTAPEDQTTNYARDLAGNIQGFVERVNPVSPEVERSFGGQVARGLGQVGGIIATGGASAAPQVAAQGVVRTATQLAQATVTGLGRTLTSPQGIVVGSQSAAPEYKAAREAGLSPEQALSTLVSNYFVGQSEAVPIQRVMSRLDNVLGGQLKNKAVNWVKNSTQGGLEEFAQEGIQTYLTNQIAKEGYDPDRDPLFGVLESAKVGGAIGLLLPGIGGAIRMADPKVRGKIEDKINKLQSQQSASVVADADLKNTTTGDPAIDLQQDIQAQQVIDEITQAKDAIQEQTAGQVPVQPETAGSQANAKGLTQAESQAITQENQNQITNEKGIQEGRTQGNEVIQEGLQGQREEGRQDVNLQEEKQLQVNEEARQKEGLQEVNTEFTPSQESTVKGDIREAIRPSSPEVVTDEYSLLKKRIRDEARGARQGFKTGVKEAKTAAKDLDLMKKVLRSSLGDMVTQSFKGLKVPQKALESTIKRISKIDVMSDSQLDKLDIFIDNVVKDANYEAKLSVADGLRKKVKGRVKSVATGTETADVRRFAAIKPENLNNEQLSQYTEVAKALDAKVPDVRPLRGVFESLVEANETAETGFTNQSTPEQVMASIGNVNDITDYASFASAKRKLSAARTKLSKMIADGAIEDDQLAEYSNQLDAVQQALDETTSKFDKEAEAFKLQRITDAKDMLKSVKPNNNKDLQQYIDRFIAIPKTQLEKMTPAEAEDYFQISEGLVDDFINRELIDFVTKAKRQSNAESLLNIGEGVKKELDKKRTFLGIVDTKIGGSRLDPLKDPDKLLDNLKLAHANNWDKILLQGKDRPIYKTLFEPIFSQVDKLTKQDNSILSKYYDTSRGVNKDSRIKIGMVLDQLDHQSNVQDGPKDKMRFLLNQDPNFPNPDAAADGLDKMGREDFDLYVETYNSLPKDAEGNLDVNAAIASLNPKEQKLMKTTQELFTQLQDRAEASTVMMGGEYRPRNNFFYNIVRQTVLKGKDADTSMTSAQAVENMLSNNSNLRTRAGSTYLRSGTPYFAELDVDKVAAKYVRDINRNYFLTPVTREQIASLRDAASKSSGETRNLFNKMYEAAKDRVISTYAFNSSNDQNKVLDTIIGGQRTLALARPERVFIEGASNLGRLLIMHGISNNASHKGFIKVMEDTNSSVLPNIGNYAEEYAAPDIHGSKTSKKLSELSQDLIAFADAKVRKLAFGTIFNKTFKEETGNDFDPQSYLTNQTYRDSVSGVVYDIGTKTDALVADLFNSTNRINAPSKTRIVPGGKLIDRASTTAKLLGYMQSFATAENATLLHSLKDVAFDTNEGRKEGAKRIASLLVSNYLYTTLQLLAFSGLMALLDDDEDIEDKLDKQFSAEGQRNSMLATTASLLTGRYGNVLRPLLKYATAVVNDYSKGDKEAEESAKQLNDTFNAAFFTGTKPLSLRYERPENFVDIIPAFGPLIGDVIGTTNSVIDMTKDFESMDESEKAYYNLGALLNTLVALRFPNPASPTIKRVLDAEIRQMNKKSKGTSVPSPSIQGLPQLPVIPQIQQPIQPIVQPNIQIR